MAVNMFDCFIIITVCGLSRISAFSSIFRANFGAVENFYMYLYGVVKSINKFMFERLPAGEWFFKDVFNLFSPKVKYICLRSIPLTVTLVPH